MFIVSNKSYYKCKNPKLVQVICCGLMFNNEAIIVFWESIIFYIYQKAWNTFRTMYVDFTFSWPYKLNMASGYILVFWFMLNFE